MSTNDKLKQIRKIKDDIDTQLMDMTGLKDKLPKATYGEEKGSIFEKRFIRNLGDNFVTKVKIDEDP